jgi:hypothetical protein
LLSSNFGADAASLDTIYLYLYDYSNYGGRVDFDNLMFYGGCPDGTKVWTTTTSSTTTTTV